MGERGQLVVVTTCTNSKRGAVRPEHHLGNLAGGFFRDAAQKWLSTLASPEVPTVAARDLYVGSHWLESQAAESAASNAGYAAELWVLSAGYGLISADESVAPYAASFATGADSIQNLGWPEDLTPRQRARTWWETLHKQRASQTLRNFISPVYESSPIILIISPEYYYAVEPEVIQLISAGTNLLIVSAGLYRNLSSASPLVRPYVLPFSDRFKKADPYLDKTNTSLNARLATWLVRNYADQLPQGTQKLAPVLADLSASLPDPTRKDVVRLSDNDVLTFIAAHYSKKLDSATKLLRHLRDAEQMSCEQKRFGALFRQFHNSNQGDLFDNA